MQKIKKAVGSKSVISTASPVAGLTPLLSEVAIAEAVERLAKNIASDYRVQTPLIVPLLRGSFMFAADMLRALSRQGMTPLVDFLWLSSYGSGTVSSGTVTVQQDMVRDVQGLPVIIVDDILESGRTLVFAKEMLLARGAASVTCAVLLEKPGKRAVAIDAEYVGITIEDHFVVGYGLDKAGHYRELPYIGVIIPSTT